MVRVNFRNFHSVRLNDRIRVCSLGYNSILFYWVLNEPISHPTITLWNKSDDWHSSKTCIGTSIQLTVWKLRNFTHITKKIRENSILCKLVLNASITRNFCKKIGESKFPRIPHCASLYSLIYVTPSCSRHICGVGVAMFTCFAWLQKKVLGHKLFLIIVTKLVKRRRLICITARPLFFLVKPAWAVMRPGATFLNGLHSSRVHLF